MRVRLLATRLRASVYIGAVWIRQPKEPHMKRLLGLLLVMGMVAGVMNLTDLRLNGTQIGGGLTCCSVRVGDCILRGREDRNDLHAQIRVPHVDSYSNHTNTGLEYQGTIGTMGSMRAAVNIGC